MMRSFLKAIGVLPNVPTFGFWNIAIPAALKLGQMVLSKKSKDKAGKNQMESAINAAKLKHGVAEDTRLSRAGLGSSMVGGLTGKGFTMPTPEALGALNTRRDYSDLIEKATPDPTAGSGSAFAAGLFGLGGDVAAQYDMNQDTGSSLSDLESSGITSQLSPEEIRMLAGEE